MVFSIIMPAYNAERFLAKSIDSVLRQTYPNWELILINDGSKDRTEEIATSYAEKDHRIRVITQNNQGVSAARNRGIKETSGDYVHFMDADDGIVPDMLETISCALKSDPSDVVAFNALRTNIDFEVTGAATEPFSPHVLVLRGEEEKRLIYSALASARPFGFACLFAAKRELIQRLQFRSDMIICEDLLFVMQMYKEAKSVICLPDYLYTYTDNPAGCVRTFNFQKLEDLKLAHAAKNALAEDKQLQDNKPEIDTWLCLIVMEFYNSIMENGALCREYRKRVREDAFLMRTLSDQQHWPEGYPSVRLIIGNNVESALLRSYYVLRRKIGRMRRHLFSVGDSNRTIGE